jgi:hypothetical protein
MTHNFVPVVAMAAFTKYFFNLFDLSWSGVVAIPNRLTLLHHTGEPAELERTGKQLQGSSPDRSFSDGDERDRRPIVCPGASQTFENETLLELEADRH